MADVFEISANATNQNCKNVFNTGYSFGVFNDVDIDVVYIRNTHFLPLFMPALRILDSYLTQTLSGSRAVLFLL